MTPGAAGVTAQSVVFLRGVNALGSGVLSPVTLVSELADLQVVNTGAAGTFVVRAPSTISVIKTRFEEALPRDANVIVRTADEIRALLTGGAPASIGGGRVFVSVLASVPRTAPQLPIEKGDPWMVRVDRIVGSFAVGEKRPVRGRWLDANAVVEQALGTRATTRIWETLGRVARELNQSKAAAGTQAVFSGPAGTIEPQEYY